MDKKAVRSELLNKRKSVTPKEQELLSQAICSHILASEAFRKAKVIMGFFAFLNEPSIDLVLQQGLRGGKIICVPYVYGKGLMKPVKLLSLDMVALDKYGIRTPKEPHEYIDAKDIDLVLASGVGFTEEGARLGMGAGFYDRFLPYAKNATIIGVTYENQIVSQLPLEDTDFKVQGLVTEKSWRNCK